MLAALWPKALNTYPQTLVAPAMAAEAEVMEHGAKWPAKINPRSGFSESHSWHVLLRAVSKWHLCLYSAEVKRKRGRMGFCC